MEKQRTDQKQRGVYYQSLGRRVGNTLLDASIEQRGIPERVKLNEEEVPDVDTYAEQSTELKPETIKLLKYLSNPANQAKLSEYELELYKDLLTELEWLKSQDGVQEAFK